MLSADAELGPSDPRVPQLAGGAPEPLWDHQRAVLHRCLAMEAGDPLPPSRNDPPEDRDHPVLTRIGVLGDRAGSGKTRIALALALSDRPANRQEQIWPTTVADGRITVQRPRGHGVRLMRNLTVVVMPRWLLSQWQRDVERFCPTSEAWPRAVVHNRRDVLSLGLNKEDGDRWRLLLVPATSHTGVSRALRNIGVMAARVILDEADQMRLVSKTEIPGDFHWYVTSAFHNLLCPDGIWVNSSPFSSGICYYGATRQRFNAMASTAWQRRILARLVVKCTNEFVEASTGVPAVGGSWLTETTILDCYRADDPPRPPPLKAAYRIAQQPRIMLDNLMERVLVPRHGENVRQRSPTAPDAACPICLNELASEDGNGQARLTVVTACCGNAYCATCIGSWFDSARSCPMCKAYQVVESVYVLDGPNKEELALPPAPPPPAPVFPPRAPDRLVQIITQSRRSSAEPRRFVVFARSVPSIHLRQTLRDAGLTSYVLSEPSQCGTYVVRELQNGNADVLFLVHSYGCMPFVGLDLSFVTDIIWYEGVYATMDKVRVLGSFLRTGRDIEVPLRVWHLTRIY
jgi:hypothetical protein